MYTYLSLFILSIALAVDGFSVSLVIAIQHRLRHRQMLFISGVIGLFHIILPFVGLLLGHLLLLQLQQVGSLIGGILLAGIGLHMFFSSFVERSVGLISVKSMKIISLLLFVSIDSFSVGLSLGMSGVNTAIVIVFFGTTAMLLSLIGLLIGSKVKRVIGQYSEMVAGIVLTVFGLIQIFK